jgi:hypothetical protein
LSHSLIRQYISPRYLVLIYIMLIYLLYYYGLERHDCFQMPTLRFEHCFFSAQGIFMIIVKDSNFQANLEETIVPFLIKKSIAN